MGRSRPADWRSVRVERQLGGPSRQVKASHELVAAPLGVHRKWPRRQSARRELLGNRSNSQIGSNCISIAMHPPAAVSAVGVGGRQPVVLAGQARNGAKRAGPSREPLAGV